MLNTLAAAMIGHLVGDYILQNDWMVEYKRKNTWVCLLHCLIWTFCVFYFAGWTMQRDAFLFLMATHFIQDRFYIIKWLMLLFGQRKFTEPPMAPWSLIVVDNVWHLIAVWYAAKHLVLHPSSWMC